MACTRYLDIDAHRRPVRRRHRRLRASRPDTPASSSATATTGYAHLTDAGATPGAAPTALRDPKRPGYDFEPASPGLGPKDGRSAARRPTASLRPPRGQGRTVLDEQDLTALVTRYRGADLRGLHLKNYYWQTSTAADAVRLARRFRDYEDMIPRFATELPAPSTSPTTAERTIRTRQGDAHSGGCWRTLQGLVDFAPRPLLSLHRLLASGQTLDALHRLFSTGPLATTSHSTSFRPNSFAPRAWRTTPRRVHTRGLPATKVVCDVR